MKPISLLIVDDSQVSRTLLKHIVESSPNIKVAGFALSGMDALAFLEKNPCDVVLMDIHMPHMDGFEATRKIMSTRPLPIIICSSDESKTDVSRGFKAIQAGALAFLEKPKGLNDPEYPAIVKKYIETILLVAEVKLVTRFSTERSSSSTNDPLNAIKQTPGIQAIAFGASLGGPQTIQKIFLELKNPFSVPMFIVQHIAEGFAEGFSKWINDTTSFITKIPSDGEIAEKGIVYISPAHCHMEVRKDNRICLVRKASLNDGICPSISRLFFSMAKAYDKHCIGLILTGMGKDGVDGLFAMKEKGAITVAQSEEDCVMFGMPKEAIQAHAASLTLPLAQIPSFLTKILNP